MISRACIAQTFYIDYLYRTERDECGSAAGARSKEVHIMVQVALDATAAGWRPHLAGPVLLADRGSDDAEVARCAAADVAAHEGVPLRLVTAWAVPAIGRVTPTAGELNISGVYETSARAAQKVVRDHLVSLGMPVGAGYVCEGSAVAVVAQTADAIDASLVVIGSRAGRGVGGHLMGLLPEAFVRGVHRPVLVVRGQSADWPPRSIIIVDADGCDDPGVAKEGAKLARVLKIPAALVRVTSRGSAAGFGWRDEPSLKSTREDVRRRASRLEAETGAEVTSWVTTGEPVGVLLGLASDPRVLVAAGRGANRHGLGRIVSALLHQATGPVLVVPEGGRDV
jgi:nucleotide-binding universal stress UspA family protein